MKKTGIHVVKDKAKKVMKDIGRLEARDVLVGIPGMKATRSNEDDSTVNNAQLGYLHETGAPAANIPARPFLLPGVRDAKKKFLPHLKKAAQAALDGKMEQMEKFLHRAGLVAMNAVQRKITTGPFTPLAASTLRRRKARGRTGNKPLIDTGQLRRSITYVVRGGSK